MGIVEILGNTTEVCRYARENLICLLMVCDSNGLEGKFRLKDCRNDVLRMENLLRGQGNLRPLKLEDLARLAFPKPDGVRHLVNMYPEVSLEDGTGRLNCGGV